MADSQDEEKHGTNSLALTIMIIITIAVSNFQSRSLQLDSILGKKMAWTAELE